MQSIPHWTETIRKVGHDSWDGDHIAVHPDADGCECVEIRYVRADGTIDDHIVLPPAAALLLAKAIADCADEMIAAEAAAKPPF